MTTPYEVKFHFDDCTLTYRKDEEILHLWRAEIQSRAAGSEPLRFDWYSPRVPDLSLAEDTYLRWVKGEPPNYLAN